MTVTKTINEVLKATAHLGNSYMDNAVRANALTVATKGYSIEAIKSAIAQSTLNAEQIKAILTAKGLTDAEIQEVITTNALTASQTGATASTFGLGTAFKGLGLSIKTATKSMIAWMATNPIGWITAVVSAIGASIYGVVKLHDALTVSLQEQKEKLQETKEAYENIKNELQEVETELQNTPNLTWVDQEELNRLREITKELELQKQLKQDAQLESAKDLYKENEKTFAKEFKSSYGNTSVSDLKEQLSSGQIGIGQLDYKKITDIPKLNQAIKESEIIAGESSDVYKEFFNEIAALAEDQADVVNDVLEESKVSLSITETVDQINTQLKPALDSLKSAYEDIFSLNEDTGEKLFSLDDVDISTFESIRAQLEKLGEIDGITIDYSPFERFVSVLSDTTSTAEEVQAQFDNLATSIIYTTDCTNMWNCQFLSQAVIFCV